MIVLKAQAQTEADDEVELITSQAYPLQDGAPEHDLDEPQECWCSPEVWAYFELDGSIGYTVVEHKWMQ